MLKLYGGQRDQVINELSSLLTIFERLAEMTRPDDEK
jgi:hypothetical protein